MLLRRSAANGLKMKSKVKILVGGVPFGRNNVGDEAILECVVQMLREACPSAEITVSTDEQEATAAKLGVRTEQLFGFQPPYSKRRMKRILAEADLFVWAGATGLSDYPEIPLRMLEIAHRAGTATVVWCVGMNTELNPFLYRLQPGRRRRWLDRATRLCGGRMDWVEWVEAYGERRARRKIVAQLSRADLVVLRDQETQAALEECGSIPGVLVGADPAELLEPELFENVELTSDERMFLESSDRKVGLCISAQREVVHQKELMEFLDQLVMQTHLVVFLPMNHETDAQIMGRMRGMMAHPERAIVIHGQREPREILAIAGKLDLVISSRLHLLILASVLHVPIIGISRGSKVDNFLAPFGQLCAGSVEACDFDHMQSELDRLIDSREEFQEVSTVVHQMLLMRLDEARMRLAELINRLQ